jgi:group I intron endonuclease
MKLTGVYKIYWLNCDYFYYGQSLNFRNRRKEHLSYLRRGIHDNRILQNVFNKYGEPEIDLIEVCNEYDLCHVEQKYITDNYGNKFCCNIDPTATGSRLSQSTKDKISAHRKGSKLSIEHKKAISEGLKFAYKTSRIHHFLGSKKEDNPFYGKNHSDECKEHMRKKKIGIYNGSSNPKARKVLNTQTNVVYGTAVEAADKNNIPRWKMYKELYKRKPTLPFKYL